MPHSPPPSGGYYYVAWVGPRGYHICKVVIFSVFFFIRRSGRKFEARGSLALALSEVFGPGVRLRSGVYGSLFDWQLGGWVVGKALRKSRRKWFKGGLSDVTAVEERRGRRGGGRGGRALGGGPL